MPIFRGACHCGGVAVAFATARDAAGLEPRACACGFCRRHGATTVSDPAGTLAIAVPGRALCYRFGLGITDFVLCAACGCYVAAVMADTAGTLGIVNLRMLEDAASFTTAAVARDYGAETVAARRARRRALWTPVTAPALA